jgi:hypothetical protein
MKNQSTMIREAVGVFDNHSSLENAIEELEISGFARREISVLASEKAVKERFSRPHVKTKLLEDNPDAPRSPDIKEEELGIAQGVLVGSGIITGTVAAIFAAGGIVAPGLVPIVIVGSAGGGIAGIVLAKLLGNKYAEFFQHQIDQGGLLLWVNTSNPKLELKAQEILKKYGAKDIHIHTIAAEARTSNRAIILDKMLVQFDDILERNKKVLKEDQTLKITLENILTLLNKAAANDQTASPDMIKSIADNIDNARSYSKDMAEEEQRIISESPASYQAKEKNEALKYFSLAKDLDIFANKYKKQSLQKG